MLRLDIASPLTRTPAAAMGRDESKTPLLDNYPNHSNGFPPSIDTTSSASSTILSGQVPIADDVPPPYSDTTPPPPPASSSIPLPNSRHVKPFLSREDLLNQEKYSILSVKNQRDGNGSKTTVISQALSSDPKLLEDFISAQARLMPNPLVRMVGTHTETQQRRKSEENTTVTDFDISISMADLLAHTWRRTKVVENGMKAYRGGRRKTVATVDKSDLESTPTAPRLEEWYHRFCASAASVKR